MALSIAKSLDKDRFDVIFASGSQGFSKAMADKWNMNIVIIPDLIREINPVKDLSALVRLYFFIKRHKFDIVHTHTSKAGVLGSVAAKLAGVPIIFTTPHGDIFHPIFGKPKTIFLLSKIENFAAQFMDKIITCSNYERKEFLKHKIGAADKYIVMNWGAMRQKDFLKNHDVLSKRKEFNIPEDVMLIGNIARLVSQKGHLFCLEGFRIVVNKFPKTKLLIVGDGVLRPAIESKINELNLKDNVIMAGCRYDIPEILASLDISLHTSIWEGAPIAIIEAMLARKAIIATDVGGIPELIENGITGILVPPNDRMALAEAIIKLINDRPRREEMGKKACQYAKEKFTLELMVENTTKLYNSYIELKIHN